MNNLCDRLNLLDINKWNCLILLCEAIKLIIIIIKKILLLLLLLLSFAFDLAISITITIQY